MTSKFDYCNALLYGVKATSLSKLQAVQYKAARTVLDIPSHIAITDDMLEQLHWLKLDKRIIFKILLFVHKLFIDKTPDWFKRQLIIIDLNERLLHNFYFDTKSGRRSFTFAAPRFWNCLEKDIRLLNDTEAFKAQIKTVLFTNKNNILSAAQGYAV